MKYLFRFIVTSLFLVLLVFFAYRLLTQFRSVQAEWFNDSWAYRNYLPITSHTAAESNVYIIATLNIGSTANAQSDLGDLRLTLQNGQIVPHYIASGLGTTAPVVHIYLKNFPAGAQTLYYYYGHSTVQNGFSLTGFPTQAANYVVGTPGTQEKTQGPLAYWKFDEGSGTTANDYTSERNNMTLSTTTWQNDNMCISGNCLYYNGDSNYASTLSNTKLDFVAADKFTLQTWFRHNNNWEYKTPIDITYSSSPLTDFQIKFTTDTLALINAGKLRSDCNDLRFYDENATNNQNLSYWIEGGTCNTTTTIVWVKIPSISGNKTIYMVYGNDQAPAGSNGDNVFDAFDDFNGSSIDTNKWSDWNPNSWGTMTVSGGILTIDGSASTGGSEYVRAILSQNTFTFSNHVVETKSKWAYTGTMGTNGYYQENGVRISSEAAPTSATSGNQYKWNYQLHNGFANIKARYYIFAKITNGSYSSVASTSLSDDNPADYRWLRYNWYSGPNQRGFRSTNNTTYSSMWTGTDALFSLPATQYFGYYIQSRQTAAPTIGYLDWIRIRKYAATEPTASVGTETNITLGATSQVLLNKFNTSISNGGYQLSMGTDGNITFAVSDSSASFPKDSVATTAGTYGDNNWHFVTAVKDGTASLKLYIDGNLVSTNSTVTSGSLANSQPFYVGSAGDGASNTWQGYIDEVKVYNYARSPSQISADYNTRGAALPKGNAAIIGAARENIQSGFTGPIGHWKFDENIGNTVQDSSGNNLNGTRYGTSTSKYLPGKFGSAGNFNSSNGDYVEIGDDNLLDLTNGMTISTWVKNTKGPSVTNSTGFKMVGLGADVNNFNGSPWISYTNIYLNDDADATTLFNNLAYTSAQVPYISLVKMLKNGSPTGTTKSSFFLSTSRESYSEGSSTDLWNTTWTYNEINASNFGFYTGAGIYDLNLDDGEASNNLYATNLGFTIPSDATISGIETQLESHYTETCGINCTYSVFVDYMSINVHYQQGGNAYVATKGVNAYNLSASSTGVITSNLNAGSSLSVTPNSNQWNHVASTYDGTNHKIYLNGVLTSSSAYSTALNTNTTPLRVGESSTGQIDDLRLYNYARSQKQIVEDMNAGHPFGGSPVGSQVAYYKFDEDYGSIAYNTIAGGSNLNGTLIGTSAPSRTNNGQYANALSFDGGDYVVLGDQASLKTTSRSIIFWAKNTGSTNTLTGVVSASDSNWYVGFASSGRMAESHHTSVDTQSLNYSDNYVIRPNEWAHYAYIIDTIGSNVYINFYLNGLPVGSTTKTNGHGINYGTNFLIGSYSTTLYRYTGLLDEVKIYNAALTADDIKKDFNQGRAVVFGSNSQNSGSTAPSNSQSQAYCVPGDSTSCLPPVAEWSLNERSGSVIYDSSGVGNSGTIAGTQLVNGVYDRARKFSSASDKITIPQSSSLNLATSVTLEAWVKLDKPPSSQTRSYPTIVTKRPWLKGGYEFRVVKADSQFYWQYNWSGGYMTTHSHGLTIVANKWYHLVGTVDASFSRFFINGVQYDQEPVTTTMASTTLPLTIGNDAGNDYLEGTVDHVRVFNYARTPAQVNWDYNRGQPAHWLKMDECQGTTLYDSINRATTVSLTINGSGTQASAGTCATAGTAWGNGVNGKFNSSLNFDGVDDTSALTTLPVQINAPLSLSMWIKPTAGGPTVQIPVNTAYGTGGEARVETWDSWATLKVNIPACGTDSSVTLPSNFVGNWHHIVRTYESGTVKTYLDGKLFNSKAYSGCTPLAKQLRLSYQAWDPDDWYRGQLDEVQIYSYALTPTQIKTLYNQNFAVRFGPP